MITALAQVTDGRHRKEYRILDGRYAGTRFVAPDGEVTAPVGAIVTVQFAPDDQFAHELRRHVTAAEHDNDGDGDRPTRCVVCGSPHVQYAVWYSPLTDQTNEIFGSWNAGDNTFCETCDTEGRDPNPNLIDRDGGDPEEYDRAARKWAKRK